MTIAMQVDIENLKCGGCARSILKRLGAVPGVTEVAVDEEKQSVTFVGEAEVRPRVVQELLSLGYPERGTLEGLSAGVANAKSFVSCALGRIS